MSEYDPSIRFDPDLDPAFDVHRVTTSIEGAKIVLSAAGFGLLDERLSGETRRLGGTYFGVMLDTVYKAEDNVRAMQGAGIHNADTSYRFGGAMARAEEATMCEVDPRMHHTTVRAVMELFEAHIAKAYTAYVREQAQGTSQDELTA